jgi:hypothetical protein
MPQAGTGGTEASGAEAGKAAADQLISAPMLRFGDRFKCGLGAGFQFAGIAALCLQGPLRHT